MRVKLQLVMCHDQGDEETVTDVITFNKNTQRIELSRVNPGGVHTPPQHPAAAPPPPARHHLARHMFHLPGLRDASAPESPLSALVSHLVWHV